MTKNQNKRIRKNTSTIKKINHTLPVELRGKPQIKGITLKVFTMTPRKPNSALRKVAKIRINCNNQIVIAYIPKEKHTLSVHNLVLIVPTKTQDLRGVKFTVLRNTLDCK